MSTRDPSALATIAAAIDLDARIAAFDDGSGNLPRLAAELWAIVEPEASAMVEAFWDFRQRRNPGQPALRDEKETARGLDHLKNRFTRINESGWVERLGQSIDQAHAAGVSTMEVMAMACNANSAAMRVLLRRMPADHPAPGLMIETLLRLCALETEVTVELATRFAGFDTLSAHERLAHVFRDGVATLVDSATEAGRDLRQQAARSSASARGMLGKTSEVAAAAEQSAVAMREAAQTAAGLIRAIEDARSEVEAAAEIATRAAGQAGQAVTMSGTLSDHARSIESILGLIRDIAGQTNLLALNATIEAARAGDAGRGFAVVAQEVKSLASQTARATDDIAGKIAAIQSATRSTVETNASIKSTVAEVQESAERIRYAMEAQAQTVTAITAAVDETALAADSMSTTVAAIREDTETVASQIDDVGRGFDALAGQLVDLRGSAGDFIAKVAA